MHGIFRAGRWGCVLRILVLMSLLAMPVSAQEANEIIYRATYLGAPTEWCPTGDGVPVILSIDGPDIFEVSTEKANWVRERRGGEGRVERAFVGKKFDEGAKTIGRLGGEFRACQNPWRSRWKGAWHVTGSTGEIASGTYDENWAPQFRFPPVERAYERATRKSSQSATRFLALGDRTFFTHGEPEEIRQIAVETDKEQSQ